MKYTAIEVSENGRDRLGTEGVITGEYQSQRNFIKWNIKHLKREQLYAVYSGGSGGKYKFEGFYSRLPGHEHRRQIERALKAGRR